MIMARPAGRRASCPLSESGRENRLPSHLVSDRANLAGSFSTAQKLTRLGLNVVERKRIRTG
jgi:hypothetical protein